MSSHPAVGVYAEVQAARGVSLVTYEEAAHQETPRQRGGGGGNHEAQQPEGELRVDVVDHPPEVHAEEPGDERERTKIVATTLAR